MKRILYFAFLVAHLAASAQSFQTTNPDSLKINTKDIVNFWVAYDRLATVKTTADSLKIVDQFYLRKATRGLKLYQELSRSDASSFLAAICTHPRLLQSIRATTLAIPTYKPSILQGAHKLKQIYPASGFPELFFCVGKFEVAGNRTNDILYIGVELTCLTKDSPRDELIPYMQAAAGTIDQVEVVCLHEMVHYQQQLDPKTNLEAALVEGGAEFIAHYLTGKSTMQSVFDRVDSSLEKTIWAEFSRQLDKPVDSYWFLATGDAARQRPGMLGYVMGYRICEAYYRKAPDKAAALQSIIRLRNPRAIYEGSGYGK
ncbi:DUF2268 domain-containing putative Zn-dependent protease [Spirosoma endophyticum]|uniref:Predicted Zn-dependent protease n=1 Tax=Spirosoma endophyticum TaxID=662367 RepID=A0A1I1Z8L7_9BACT|nr:DUF2268 domain-containing putative Zn-dependent protease [Spirosoma endophyticum]SFE28039.1 Predicted Zn-dependent protease [Spirosoma endophyticum]